MDKLYIRDLTLRAIIGTFPEERREKQDLIFNIELGCDLTKAGNSDDLNDTVDYKKIKKDIIALVESSAFQLIEKLAAETAAICLANPLVQYVKVIIDKPNALRFARSAAIEIERKR